TIYVTHDQAEALALGDQIAVLNQGRLQQIATPDEIYNQPANRFVADFFGPQGMNWIEGELKRDGEATKFIANEIDWPLHSTVPPGEGTVLCGFRPEDFQRDSTEVLTGIV